MPRMSSDPQAAARPTPSASGPRVVVITVVRDEAELLPLWIAHYGREFGHESLLVIDDNSEDGSTNDLPCMCYRLPRGPWKAGWGRTRQRLVNGLAAGLLAVNDWIIYTDVDEFLVADPLAFSGLGDFLQSRSETDVIAPLAVELVHHTGIEPALDLSQPILEQRRFVKYSPALCKPLVKRVNSRWSGAFHANASAFAVDPALWMFHLKFADERLLRQTARRREEIHRAEGRGHPRSFWSMTDDEVARRLERWTHGVNDPNELDSADLDLSSLVQRDNDGYWQATANQVASLEETPLRRVPERFTGAF